MCGVYTENQPDFPGSNQREKGLPVFHAYRDLECEECDQRSHDQCESGADGVWSGVCTGVYPEPGFVETEGRRGCSNK